jgi:hypothetical protein
MFCGPLFIVVLWHVYPGGFSFPLYVCPLYYMCSYAIFVPLYHFLPLYCFPLVSPLTVLSNWGIVVDLWDN